MPRKSKQRYCKQCSIEVGKGKSFCEECRRLKRNASNRKYRLPHKDKCPCSDCNPFSLPMRDIVGKVTTYNAIQRKSAKKLSEQKSKLPNLHKQRKQIEKEYKAKLHDINKQINMTGQFIGNIKYGQKISRPKKLQELYQSIYKQILIDIPINKYTNKKEWAKDVIELEEYIFNRYDCDKGFRNTKFSIYGYRKYRKDLTPLWTKHIDDKVKELVPHYTGTAPFTLICDMCNEVIEYPTRTALVRALGLNGGTDKKNASRCKPCGMKWERTQEFKDSQQLYQLKELGFNSFQEYEDHIFIMGDKDKYSEAVRDYSQRNLKQHNPSLYQEYENRRWQVKDTNPDTALSIEHIKPVVECWVEKIPIKEAADVSNLEVITMRENWKNWQQWKQKNKY